MDKIAERKGDLAKKQQALDDKKTEIRSFVDDADKTTDEVKAGMSDIKEKEAEIETLKEEIAILEQAAGRERQVMNLMKRNQNNDQMNRMSRQMKNQQMKNQSASHEMEKEL